MYLYILRHGDAKPKSEDPERSLSDRGHQEVAGISRVFARLKPSVDAIWHSGKTRARQTAGILADTLKTQAPIQGREGLNPNDPLDPILSELTHRDANLVIVGHLPQLAKLISVLLTGKEQNLLDIPAAGLVCLENINGSWQLCWFLTPDFC